MVSKSSDHNKKNCVRLTLEYGLDTLSDKDAEALVNLFDDIIVHHSPVEYVDVNLQSYDTIKAVKK